MHTSRDPGGLAPGHFFASSFARRLVPILFALVAVPLLPPLAENACAQEQAAAGIVIRFDAGRETTHCVDLGEAGPNGVSGLEALRATGLVVVTKDFGGDLGQAVCKIEEVGTDDCNFGTGFWAYFRGSQGQWSFAETGPSSSRVEGGGVEGWVWTPAEAGDATPPTTAADFDRICLQETTPVEERRAPRDSILSWAIVAMAIAIGGALVLRRRGA